jgi:hypothetical protein
MSLDQYDWNNSTQHNQEYTTPKPENTKHITSSRRSDPSRSVTSHVQKDTETFEKLIGKFTNHFVFYPIYASS